MNVGNQGGNAGSQGENAGNQSGNTGNGGGVGMRGLRVILCENFRVHCFG